MMPDVYASGGYGYVDEEHTIRFTQEQAQGIIDDLENDRSVVVEFVNEYYIPVRWVEREEEYIQFYGVYINAYDDESNLYEVILYYRAESPPLP